MALKPYNELVKLDVSGCCDLRDAKDENGKKIKVPYLSWAKCKQLLHENGAETVYYTPLRDENGSFVWCSKETQNKDGRRCGCYFVAVEVHIDDLVFRMDMPLLNGSLVVYEDTLNQLRISNSQARAFVKGVAIHTGLGFGLWLGDKETDDGMDDLSQHNIWAIKERIERLITAKEQNGMDHRVLLDKLGLTDKQFKLIMAGFQNINAVETKLKTL